MNKSRLRAIKWLGAGVRDALKHPTSDKIAKGQVTVWAALLVVVLANLTMALLVGTMSGFVIGFTLVGLVAYSVFLKWALEGVAYRRSERRRFDEIVNNA